MINICFADNSPVVHEGINSYFSKNTDMVVAASVKNYKDLLRVLSKGKIQFLILDVDLEGFSSITFIKNIISESPGIKILIYSNVSDTMYAPPAIKSGAHGYVSKNIELFELEETILRISEGSVIYSDEVRHALDILNKTKKENRLFKKLSSREIEVLRYFNEGKKNKEIAKILLLDEKTISTYKLRLLNKLSVTNLLDLVNKAKELGIIS